jgi:hypothetical protein
MKLIDFVKDQTGSTLPLVGVMMIGLLAATGLVIDMGSLYVTKAHLQKAANAAVLSGAQELTNSELAVNQIVNTVITEHDEASSVQAISITMNDQVSIELNKEVDLKFAQLAGWDSAPVSVRASAKIDVMGRAAGAAPLGIDEGTPLELYKEYKLKVDQTDVDTGNFGVLALGGTGASTYEDNLLNGYQNVVGVGDVIDTQTGNISGKTRTVIEERINNCPYEPGEMDHRDCSRILLVPVYKVHSQSSNQLKSIQITGFSYFYITEPMSSKDTSITGKFIKRTGTGFADPTAVSKGAFSIRLTE